MKCPVCKKGDLFLVHYKVLVDSTPLNNEGDLIPDREVYREEDSEEISCNNCSFRIDLPENYTFEDYQEKIKLIKEKQ